MRNAILAATLWFLSPSPALLADANPLGTNNRHYVSPDFEYFAEEPRYVNQSAGTGNANRVPASLGQSRSRIFLLPKITLGREDIEIYVDGELLQWFVARRVDEVWSSLAEEDQKLAACLKLKARAKADNSGLFIADQTCQSLLYGSNSVKVDNAIQKDLETRTLKAWMFLSLKPQIVTREDKEQIISTLTNLPREDIPDELLRHYSYEWVPFSAVSMKVELGEETFEYALGQNLMTSNSSFIIYLGKMGAGQVRELSAGLFSVSISGSVDLTKVGEAFLHINYEAVKRSLQTYFLERLRRVSSRSSGFLFFKSTRTSLYEAIQETARNSVTSRVSQGASVYTRDLNISTSELQTLYDKFFPSERMTLDELIQRHKDLAQSGESDFAKKLSEAYIALLEADREEQSKAYDRMGKALDDAAEASPKHKGETAIMKFLLAGFSVSNRAQNELVEVRRFREDSYYESREGSFNIAMASQASQAISISRADFREQMRVSRWEEMRREAILRESKRLESIRKEVIGNPGSLPLPDPGWTQNPDIRQRAIEEYFREHHSERSPIPREN